MLGKWSCLTSIGVALLGKLVLNVCVLICRQLKLVACEVQLGLTLSIAFAKAVAFCCEVHIGSLIRLVFKLLITIDSKVENMIMLLLKLGTFSFLYAH